TPRAVASYQEQDSYVAFSQGKAAFHRSWPYVLKTGLDPTSKLYGKVGFCRIPGKRGPAHGCLGTWNLAVSARTRYPREACLLIDFLTNPHAQKTCALESATNPSLAELYSDPDLLRQRPYLPQFLHLIETGKSRPTTPLYPKVSRILQIQVHRALTGEMTPKAALDEAAWKLEELRRRYPGVPLT
ncbi:MAG: extracellular solute-binding protein, partial [Candidatus Eremiobacterota bacterium]